MILKARLKTIGGYSKVKSWAWSLTFKSKKERIRFIVNQAEELRPHLPMDAGFFTQVFIAGDNIAWDFMSGSLEDFYEAAGT